MNAAAFASIVERVDGVLIDVLLEEELTETRLETAVIGEGIPALRAHRRVP